MSARPASSRLGPAERAAALVALSGGDPRLSVADPLDVLVIGGGVVGAGAALDAATRGLRVGLVDARDWASGTSSRSSKLIHGGLRYLEMLDFPLVREALRERGLLLQRLAPHLVRPVPFLYPLRHRGWERPYVGAGVALYDALGHSTGHSRGLPRHRHLSRTAALEAAPGLRADALVGAVQYWDGQVDDARHTLTLVRTAAAYGAHCANRCRVVGFLRGDAVSGDDGSASAPSASAAHSSADGRPVTGADSPPVTGVRLRDLETGRELDVRARQVINATGVWTDDTQTMLGAHGPFSVRASKGVHLLVPRDRIASTTGLILRTETSVLFVIPWGRPVQTHWIVGTTDTSWRLDKAHPAASARDIDYLLSTINEVLASRLVAEDVIGVYAGLRPLLAGESDVTSRLSREHTVARPAPGLVVVAGGKYTTYRVMAKDAVDLAAEALRGDGGRRVPESVTEDVPLLGALGYQALHNAADRLAAESGLPVPTVQRLLGRYGSLLSELFELVRTDPALAGPVTGASNYLRAEVVYAAEAEGARHLDDVLARRTHVSVETRHRGVDCAEEVAALLAPVLGWDDCQRRREVEHYIRRVAAERASQRQRDDEMADSARRGAPEIVPVE